MDAASEERAQAAGTKKTGIMLRNRLFNLRADYSLSFESSGIPNALWQSFEVLQRQNAPVQFGSVFAVPDREGYDTHRIYQAIKVPEKRSGPGIAVVAHFVNFDEVREVNLFHSHSPAIPDSH